MIKRRTAIGSLLSLAAPWPAIAAPTSMPAPRRLLLWPAGQLPSATDSSVNPTEPPGGPGGGSRADVHTDARGAISHITEPWLEVYEPRSPSGAAVLVAGGGGYKRIEMALEAEPAARWLAEQGVTAFVLAYRLPTEGWRDGPLAPLQDAQRAVRLIRSLMPAAGPGPEPARLGLLGFSAGGHLLGMAATCAAWRTSVPLDSIDELPAHVDSAALIYPVITLQPPFDHTSTRRSLIGPRPGAGASARWSVQTHVDASSPPMFLVQAEDDPISNPANTLIMANACQRAGVPCELHRLASGGHGFGMGQPGTAPSAWPGWYAEWLQRRGFLLPR